MSARGNGKRRSENCESEPISRTRELHTTVPEDATRTVREMAKEAKRDTAGGTTLRRPEG